MDNQSNLPVPSDATAGSELGHRRNLRLSIAAAKQSGPRISGTKLWAAIIILVFFGIFGAWSTLASLSSAAIAPGVISPEGDRRPVQHLEGGIVEKVHVREGSRVRRGDLLVTIDDTQSRASHQILKVQHHTLHAILARLKAEQLNAEHFKMPAWLKSEMEPGDFAELRKVQDDLFNSQRTILLSKEELFRKEIDQLRQKIRGLKIEIDAKRQELELIDAQLADLSGLLERGLTPKTKVISLRREQIRINGQIGEKQTQIAEANLAIARAERAIVTDRESYLDRVNREIGQTRTLVAEVETKLNASLDKLTRTEIFAPISGTVIGLKFTTSEEVIRASEELMYIVPNEAELLVDARVSPMDIDNVTVGHEARVTVSALGHRNQGNIMGEVVHVSADRLTDERTGRPYFLAKVKIDPDTLVFKGEPIEITAGMSADVFILTGESTVLEYLIDPFVKSIAYSFRQS